MQRILPLVAAQARPRLIGEPGSAFADEVKAALQAQPHSKLVVFPELHLFGDEEPDLQRTESLQASAEPLDGPRVKELKQLAKDLNIWLVPGSVCERGPEGQLFNTQLVLSPEGELAGFYRKIFPWRPFEPYDPGDRFTTVHLPGIGRVGLNICYDAWYPEVSRQLAWMGADVILNVVKTTTPDRKQELILAKANAIVNQVFMVSVNCAGPTGQGKSIIVDPEGNTLAEAPDDEPELLTAELDLAAVEHVRTHGTENLNRPWSQFREGEPAVELSVYQGRINPATWTPPSYKP
ncbi:carbon-nitrogen hydrolase family protein [Pseudarthrobacter phenanthrenivorans]|uniref:Carbon-nitrogen hydrolase family protein n=1 Tax=Pseudarthrobacter phenanthrenivorans TaxID=361575 RepID=A0A3B0G799_PSEPS|nr:carbon-nitrogen hydrolase family protein [Pseudarthrobacter phenanthrenivorans]RKO26117.1 carbon-nitrogen hydrolase family protein [Pseudarthrobacter phenanthrenivorans]